MNVASQEVCLELYEASGWEVSNSPTQETWMRSGNGFHSVRPLRNENATWMPVCPAYNLGYLLRKLPTCLDIEKNNGIEELAFYRAKYLAAEEHHGMTMLESGTEYVVMAEEEADSPEDALCQLAIELFKQGVLTK